VGANVGERSHQAVVIAGEQARDAGDVGREQRTRDGQVGAQRGDQRAPEEHALLAREMVRSGVVASPHRRRFSRPWTALGEVIEQLSDERTGDGLAHEWLHMMISCIMWSVR
jgi:hypothetical protein